MNLGKVLAELQEERTRVEEAIEVLMRVSSGEEGRRGRPPKWLAGLTPKRRGRPPGRAGVSEAARKAQSARMKKYWVARKRKAKS